MVEVGTCSPVYESGIRPIRLLLHLLNPVQTQSARRSHIGIMMMFLNIFTACMSVHVVLYVFSVDLYVTFHLLVSVDDPFF